MTKILYPGAIVWLLIAPVVTAQEPATPAPGKRSALSIRQEGVEARMQALERKLLRLVQVLRSSEPDQAARLERALRTAKKKLIERRLAKIVTLLDNRDFDNALGGQKSVAKELAGLLEILLKEDDEYERIQEEIKRLERWRKHIQMLQNEERGEKRESEKVADPEQAIQALQDKIERLQKLTVEQKKILAATEEQRDAGKQDLDRLVPAQDRVKQGTQELAKSMGNADKEQDADQVPADADPGYKELKAATGHQAIAKKNLAKRKGASAAKEQKQALAGMKQALAAMKKEQQRLRSLPPDQSGQMSQLQEATADKTADLAQEMSEAAAKSQQTDPQSASPGQQNVKSAESAMSKAAGDLGKKSPQKATPKQQQAIDELEKAKQELDKKLSDLRKQQQDALLAKLQEIFELMLKRQQAATKTTIGLNTKKADWSRAETLACANLATAEQHLAGMAQTTIDMMTKDGASTVFPAVTNGLKQDLLIVHGYLVAADTGRGTRSLQKHIEQTLRDLLQALDMARDDLPQEEQPQQSDSKDSPPNQGKPPPLVSDLAELKLLRMMQARVNNRTHIIKQELKADHGEGLMAEEYKIVSRQQAAIKEMADQLLEKARKRKTRK